MGMNLSGKGGCTRKCARTFSRTDQSIVTFARTVAQDDVLVLGRVHAARRLLPVYILGFVRISGQSLTYEGEELGRSAAATQRCAFV
jgi:hypothetical protein